MKRTVNCKIESISSPGETAWIISLPEEAAYETAMLLALLNQGKVPQVKFADKSRSAVIRPESGGYVLVLKDTQATVTQTWLDALTGMLMDVYFNGWSDTSHLDQDLEKMSVTVRVLPLNR